MNTRVREAAWGYAFLAPALILLLGLTVVPLVYAFWISLHDWQLISLTKPFVGFANYVATLHDKLTIKSLQNTLYFTVGAVPLQMAIALSLAMALNTEGLHLRRFYRMVYFLPYITTWVAVAYVWRWLLEPRYGLVNAFLRFIGIAGPAWLGDPGWALPAVIMTAVWKSLGYSMLMFLAGLQGIPKEMYEAAAIDGANKWHRFRYVTVPLLNSTILFVLVVSVINSLQVFTPAVLMTTVNGEAGGPINSTRVLVYHIYSVAFRQRDLGLAAATSFMLFLLTMVITLIQIRMVQRRVDY